MSRPSSAMMIVAADPPYSRAHRKTKVSETEIVVETFGILMLNVLLKQVSASSTSQ